MADFRELEVPYTSLVDGRFWFYVRAIGSPDLYLRNDSTVLDDGGDDYDRYTFWSESLAHLAAAEYYESYNKIYPYHDEWKVAVQRDSGDILELHTKTVESQVMEFE